MAEPQTAVDLGKLENDLQPAEVTRFAPSKYRDPATLEAIQNDVRKCIDELDSHIRRLDEYRQTLKASRDAIARTIG
jgi:hypothetical protein